jgi:DNA-binding LacI/PurR family transcriptional regulator
MADPSKTSRNEGATLKELAKHLGLTKGTVSAVLNDSPYAKAIPQHTKDRIVAAARDLNYRPNYFARTLRKKRTFTVGVIAAEIGDAYGSIVISGIESGLSERKYFFMTVAHHHDPGMLRRYSDILQARGAEGFITVDTTVTEALPLPTVVLAGHRPIRGVTNIVLDHRKSADIVLNHLTDLGHRDIAVIKGQPGSADAEVRWTAIDESAKALGIDLKPDLLGQLEMDDVSPEQGYKATRALLARNRHFSALFAYNDISAIGAIRAIRETGLRVPADISVVGFDDIREAAYHLPSLTTVRQPLLKMGELAAQTLVEKLEEREDLPDEITVDPELVVRESTGVARGAIAHHQPS